MAQGRTRRKTSSKQRTCGRPLENVAGRWGVELKTEGTGGPGTGNHVRRGERELPSGRQGCLLFPRQQGDHARLRKDPEVCH